MRPQMLAVYWISLSAAALARAEAPSSSLSAWTLAEPTRDFAIPPGDPLARSAPSDPWIPLRDIGWYNWLRDVYALPGTNLLWAVGESWFGPDGINGSLGNPAVCRSADGGATWSIDQPDLVSLARPDQNIHLWRVWFFGSAAGVAGGMTAQPSRAEMFSTDDGGLNWTLRFEGPPSPPLITYGFADLDFVDLSEGWAAGLVDTTAPHVVFHTVDGGTTWAPQAVPVRAAFWEVEFVDSMVGYLGGNLGYVLKTTTGGNVWSVVHQALDLSYTRGLAFVSPEIGLRATPEAIHRTDDGGMTWSQVYPGVPGQEFWDIQMFDALQGMAVGEGGLAVSTQDGGLTWSVMGHTGGEKWAVASSSAGTYVTVGSNGAIAYSIDAGTTWREVDGERYLTAQTLRDVFFHDDLEGWSVGHQGVMLRTQDGGQTWRHHHGPSDRLEAIAFVNDLEGWVLGSQEIWRTADGGEHWNMVSATPITATDMDFATPLVGWICGAGGQVQKTEDGGQTWDALTTPTVEGLYGVEFVDADVGWVVGWNGTVLSTGDGGDNWDPQEVPVVEPLYDVVAIDGLTAWVAGISHVFATQDGGANWVTQHEMPLPDYMACIDFVDADTGVVAGGSVGAPVLYGTDDGGAQWQLIEDDGGQSLGILDLGNKIFGVSLPSADVGFVVGSDGWAARRGPVPTSVGPSHPEEDAAAEGSFVSPGTPNPFSSRTVVSFSLTTDQSVDVRIYDLRGRLVRRLEQGSFPAGRHEIVWNGRDDRGRALASGTYFCRVEAGGRVETTRLVLAK